MSYDLAVWHGPRPADDEAAAEEYERRAGLLEDDDPEPAAASPAVQAFLDAVLRRFPPLTAADDGDSSPWAMGPEPGEVDGDFVYLTMTFAGADAHLDEVVAVAHAHGLVCFDPQTEALA